jgi:hypothetical protein
LPAITGFQSTFANVGKVRNSGFELELTTNNLVKKFKWSTNFNFSYLENEVLELNTDGDQILTHRHITKVGGEIGAFYGYKKIGIYNTQEDLDKYPAPQGGHYLGVVMYEDVNKDGVISGLDETTVGSPHPDFILGMTNRFSYKNFDLSVLLTSSLGYSVFHDAYAGYIIYVQRGNVSRDVLERWRSPEDPGAGHLGMTAINAQNRYAGSILLENGNHLWVKNVTFGYNIPQSFLSSKNLPIQSVRLYANAQNLFLYAPGIRSSNPEASHITGADGDSKTLGEENGTYPVPRTISFGININF